jgi:hypothetical protein
MIKLRDGIETIELIKSIITFIREYPSGKWLGHCRVHVIPNYTFFYDPSDDSFRCSHCGVKGKGPSEFISKVMVPSVIILSKKRIEDIKNGSNTKIPFNAYTIADAIIWINENYGNEQCVDNTTTLIHEVFRFDPLIPEEDS